MVNLMQPTLVTFMGKQPEGLDQTKICIQLENNLRFFHIFAAVKIIQEDKIGFC